MVQRTETIDIAADVPLPIGVRALVELGMGRWARRLHVRDLEQLRTYVETGAVHRTDAAGGR